MVTRLCSVKHEPDSWSVFRENAGFALPVLKPCLARHSERGKKTRRTKEEVGRHIREWTGLEFGKSQRAVENRQNGENWLQSHLWCPNDPLG